MTAPHSSIAITRGVRQTAVLASLCTIATAIAAQVAIPIPGTPVPLALAPMMVVLTGIWLGPRAGAASMAAYVALGALGLPVFAPVGAPGLARLLGPTGGYLLAYPVAAAVTGAIARRAIGAPMRIVAALTGMVVIHVGGIAQLALLTGSLSSAVALGSAPFALGDVVKAFVAGLLPRRSPSA